MSFSFPPRRNSLPTPQSDKGPLIPGLTRSTSLGPPRHGFLDAQFVDNVADGTTGQDHPTDAMIVAGSVNKESCGKHVDTLWQDKKQKLTGTSPMLKGQPPPRKPTFKFQSNEQVVIGRPVPTQKKELTLDEIEQTWWKASELRMFHKRAHAVRRALLENPSVYKLALVRSLHRCGADAKPNYKEVFGDYDEVYNESLHCEADDTNVLIDFADTARGLEKKLLDGMGVPFYRHERSVQAVLLTQRKMREKGYTVADIELEIASRYKRHCEYASKFAYMIASCDTAAAL